MKKYPKLEEKENCAYPERDNCNFDENTERCEFMKYDNSYSINDHNRWKCTFKK